jgi:hypothetical protein
VTPDSVADGQPPVAVRAAFALFLVDAILALVNATVQVTFHVSRPLILVGALLEAVLFVLLGAYMRHGRTWARTALMSFAGVFAALGILIAIGTATTPDPIRGVVLFGLLCVAGKIVLIVAGAVMMYRPGARGYFS